MARAVVVLPIRFAVGAHAVQATTRALTPEAVFVRSMARPHPGVKVSLRLYLPSGAPEDLVALVEERPAPENETGFWAVFSGLTPAARARIEQVLQPPMLGAVPAGAAAAGASVPARAHAASPAASSSANRVAFNSTCASASANASAGAGAAAAGSLPLGADARCTQRVAAALQVGFHTVAELREEMTLNVSAGGMFVRTGTPPPLRELVVLRLLLPGEAQPVVVQAQVVHRVTQEEARLTGRPAGAGVQFIDGNDHFRERLDAWLAKTR